MCVSDQVSQLSEVSTDRVEDSQQDVDVRRVKPSWIWRMHVLGQNLLQLTYKRFKEQEIKLLQKSAKSHNIK